MQKCLFCPTIDCDHKRRRRFSSGGNLFGREKFVMYLNCIFGYNPNAHFPFKKMYPPCICNTYTDSWKMEKGELNCSGFVDRCIYNFTGESIELTIFNNLICRNRSGGLLNIADVREIYNDVVSKCHISDIEAGDIIWTYTENSPTYQHVMFYMGNKKVAGMNHPNAQRVNGIYDITKLYQEVTDGESYLLIPHGDTRRFYIDKLSFDFI